MKLTLSASLLHGSVAIPPSKSAAHRAIIAAALAQGRSTIHNVDLSSDMRATIGACRCLGCAIDSNSQDGRCTLTVDGGMRRGEFAVIDCCESGSTLRFFIPIAAALGGNNTFTGSGRLPQRPIDAYIDIFKSQSIAYNHPAEANLPLTVSGQLRSGDFSLDGRVSSQYVTGLLFALPLLDTASRIDVLGGFESRGYVDMTALMLRRFGVQVDTDGDSFSIAGGQTYQPQTITVEGDYSQAAFFLVAGAIAGEVRINGLSEDSLQPDSAIIHLLRQMGADISRDGRTLVSRKSALHGTEIDVSQCPDIVPPLAIAAAFAQGQTRIVGAARLRIKESDRLSALAQNLARIGIKAEETPDSLTITGGMPTGGEIDAFGDHRIAMAFAVAAMGAKESITISGAECVDKSYPAFYEDLKALGGNIL